jgi:hypothetical protein
MVTVELANEHSKILGVCQITLVDTKRVHVEDFVIQLVIAQMSRHFVSGAAAKSKNRNKKG